jgi:hypothetical protein
MDTTPELATYIYDTDADLAMRMASQNKRLDECPEE